MPLRSAQWVSVSESPAFATEELCGSFAVTGTSHPACLTRKVNVVRNPADPIGHRCVIETDFSAVAIRGGCCVLSCCAGVAPARFQRDAHKPPDVMKQSELI